MIPSVGRIVHIILSDDCASNIIRNRVENHHVGNPVYGGEVFPMVITKIWSDNPTDETAVQGQIFLDGNDTYWATSVKQGTEKGQWYSPVGE